LKRANTSDATTPGLSNQSNKAVERSHGPGALSNNNNNNKADPQTQRNAQGTVQRNAQGAIQRNAQGTVQRNAQGTVQRNAQGSVIPDEDGVKKALAARLESLLGENEEVKERVHILENCVKTLTDDLEIYRRNEKQRKHDSQLVESGATATGVVAGGRESKHSFTSTSTKVGVGIQKADIQHDHETDEEEDEVEL
jgi:hypothetical protein